MTMTPRRPFGAPALAILAALGCSTALAGGACSNGVPSDQGVSSSSSTGGSRATSASSTSSSSTGATTSSGGTGGASSSSGTGGAGTGDAGPDGAGGAPDCYPSPMTYLEIINACTTAQEIDLSPVLPLLEPDGGLPPLP
jgi:hypothetical protein